MEPLFYSLVYPEKKFQDLVPWRDVLREDACGMT
jgi:hypothetical protein